jgi:hypothetical protein
MQNKITTISYTIQGKDGKKKILTCDYDYVVTSKGEQYAHVIEDALAKYQGIKKYKFMLDALQHGLIVSDKLMKKIEEKETDDAVSKMREELL